MWLYFQPKNYPILKKPVYVIIISSQKSIQSEGTWLGDCILRNWIYPILRGPDYVFILSSQKSIPLWGDLTCDWFLRMKSNPFWGDLTMWLYFQPKNYPNLRRPVYVIILSNQNLSHSEGTWLCDHTFQPKIYPILRGSDYVIVNLGMKSNPFWGDLTTWL